MRILQIVTHSFILSLTCKTFQEPKTLKPMSAGTQALVICLETGEAFVVPTLVGQSSRWVFGFKHRVKYSIH